MNIKIFFDEYVKNQFISDHVSIPFDCFKYQENEYGDKEIFFLDKNETFLGWDSSFFPEDPYYAEEHELPLLCDKYNNIDVYDQIILFYLLYTVNSSTLSPVPDECNKINVFMKQYCFFQLSQISYASFLSEHESSELRDFFWFYFLYSHPVNETTLYSCKYSDGKLVYKDKEIYLSDYFDSYYEFFVENYERVKNKINLTKDEILSSKEMTRNIFNVIEGNGCNLQYFNGNPLVNYVNDVSLFINRYENNRDSLFSEIFYFAEKCETTYDNYILSVILQNYVCYVLKNNFNEITCLSDYLHSREKDRVSFLIINKIFSDSIFVKKICLKENIDISKYKYIISYFDEESKRINLD